MRILHNGPMEATRLSPRALLLAGLIATTVLPAAEYRLETVAEGLDYPWCVAFLPDRSMLVTELGGRLRRVEPDGALGAPIAGVPPVYRKSQGGLFDVLPHPDFAINHTLYLSYAEGTPGDNGTAVTRARLAGDVLEDLSVIFRVASRKDTPVHYGGRMAFRADGTLLLTTGDGFDYREAAQDQSSQLGKVLRMTADGHPAPGNPFADAPYVWTYGHRNPQGLAIDRAGVVWLHDHGPRGGDEVNVIEPGNNYGWPAITHGIDYSGALISPYQAWPGMVAPVYQWTPSIAPSGLAVYEGALFPAWRGDLFVGALVAREVRRLDLEHGAVVAEERLFSELETRIRDLRNGPDGALYVVTDGPGGRILKAVPAR